LDVRGDPPPRRLTSRVKSDLASHSYSHYQQKKIATMFSLKKLFHPKPTSSDGLTQSQREAIVDLLNYCSYADRDITQGEEDMIDGLGSKLDWDQNMDFDYYMDKSLGVVRNVIEQKDSMPYFLKDVRTRLDSKKSRETALGLCDKLFKADGKVTAEESETFKAIAEALK
jgi:hypothetical protein